MTTGGTCMLPKPGVAEVDRCMRTRKRVCLRACVACVYIESAHRVVLRSALRCRTYGGGGLELSRWTLQSQMR